MDVSIGMKAEEMHRMAVFARFNRLFPNVALEHGPGFNRFVHQFRALIEDAASAQRVMSDFRIAHIVVRRQPDGDAMRLKLAVQLRAKQLVKRRSLSQENRVRIVLFADSNAIHND